MNYITLVGFVAAFFTTMSFLPQAIQTIKTRKTKDISFRMYIMMNVGVFFWLVYGILLNDKPIIYANIVTLSLSSTILVMKLRHG